jgi:hypothetical protein
VDFELETNLRVCRRRFGWRHCGRGRGCAFWWTGFHRFWDAEASNELASVTKARLGLLEK